MARATIFAAAAALLLLALGVATAAAVTRRSIIATGSATPVCPRPEGEIELAPGEAHIVTFPFSEESDTGNEQVCYDPATHYYVGNFSVRWYGGQRYSQVYYRIRYGDQQCGRDPTTIDGFDYLERTYQDEEYHSHQWAFQSVQGPYFPKVTIECLSFDQDCRVRAQICLNAVEL